VVKSDGYRVQAKTPGETAISRDQARKTPFRRKREMNESSGERLIRNNVIDVALISLDSQRRLQESYDLLDRMLSRGRFNREHAVEILTFTIDNAVWADLKGSPDNRSTYARYKESGLGPKIAQEACGSVYRRQRRNRAAFA
jgi:hypothetical protein